LVIRCIVVALTSRGEYDKVVGVKGRIAAVKLICGFALGVATTLAITSAWAAWADAPRSVERAKLSRASFDQALDAVLTRYYEPVDETKLLSAGLRAILAELDPHTHFVSAVERKALRDRTSGGTTGMSVALRIEGAASRLEVLAVAPGSPAERSGVRPGDHLVRIGEREVEELRSQIDAELLLAGAVGDEVALFVQSPDDDGPRQIELVLEKPRAQNVEHAVVDLADGRKAVHLVLRRFASESGDAIKKAIAKRKRVLGDQLAGIVIDLRSNPGGEVSQALVIADLFVAEGVLTRTRGRGGRILREEKAHAQGADLQTPLVILQDRHSASASELLAAALQDHGRAKVVGERSYGKGTVQEVLGLPDGSVATFTIARYFSPKDRAIDGSGVAPDVHLVMTPKIPKVGEVDDGLRAAIEALGAKPR
jgi:carboxyl-terminal processing protease